MKNDMRSSECEEGLRCSLEAHKSRTLTDHVIKRLAGLVYNSAPSSIDLLFVQGVHREAVSRLGCVLTGLLTSRVLQKYDRWVSGIEDAYSFEGAEEVAEDFVAVMKEEGCVDGED